MKEKFRIFPHTADVGISVCGDSFSDLFENAAVGMISLLLDPKDLFPKKKIFLSVSGMDWESLLVNWLSEILYIFAVKKIGCSGFKITKISPFKIKAICRGEPLDLKRHKVYKEIKAATYHNLKIKKIKSGYSTKIIFDI